MRRVALVAVVLALSLPGTAAAGEVSVELRTGEVVVARHACQAGLEPTPGSFDTGSLTPGIYTLRVSPGQAQTGTAPAERQVILAPDPFAW